MNEDEENLKLKKSIMKTTIDQWGIFREAIEHTEHLFPSIDGLKDHTNHLKQQLLINIILNYDDTDKENKVDVALKVIEELKKTLIDMDKHINADDGFVIIEGFE